MSKLYSRLLGLGALFLGLNVGPALAQTVPPHRTCGTQEADAMQQAELQRLIPGYNPAKLAKTAPSTKRLAAMTYTLPVVVHVIHNGEAVGSGTNLAAGQIQSQIDVLNEDYRKLNADGNNTAIVPTVFQALRGDTQLQFQLATRDPNGNVMAEPGIDRVNRNTKGFTYPTAGYTQAYINATIKPNTYWNPEQYINIWVMNLGGGLLGYAQFPDNTAQLGGLSASGGTAATDGVVILYYAFGSRLKFPTGNYGGTSNPYDKGRTLTHELGHFFGMRHIWGDADCGNDYVADTPVQFEENYSCPGFPHVSTQCGNGPNGDMFMNYMDYVDDGCMAMFSSGQADRMQAVMAAGTPRRSNLLSSPAICSSVVTASVSSAAITACSGTNVTLSATGPAGATYYWTGPNGYTSTTQSPTLSNITATQAGTYAVIVTPGSGTACPARLSVVVTVNPTPPTPTITPSVTTPVCSGTAVTLTGSAPTATGTLPSADFNSGLPTGWTIGNTGAAATTWQVTTGNTYTYAPLSLTNFSLNNSRFAIANSDAGGQGSTTNTTLTSPVFSTVGYSALSVSFQQVIVLDTGYGAVEVSTDGGTTWTAAATYGSNLTTTTTSTVNLSAYLNQPSVRLRWHYVDAWGYLWAVDNIALTGTPASYTYSWSLVSGDGLPTTTNTAAIAVTPTQNSVYRLSTNFAGGACSSTATVSVQIVPTPTLATSATSVCPGASAQLSATNIPTTGYTYSWSLVSGNGLPTTTNTAGISVSPTQNSVYRLTVTAGNCSTSSTIAVAVVSLPTPTLVAASSAVCVGSSTQLSASNYTGTGYTYSWSLVSGDGLPTTTNTAAITVTPTQNSVYRLTVNSNGCTSTATISVSAVSNSITAYPVPFGDAGLSLQVSTCTAGPVSVQIFDMLGRRVYDRAVTNVPVGSTTVTLSGTERLLAGKYVVKVFQGSQNLTFNVVRQ